MLFERFPVKSIAIIIHVIGQIPAEDGNPYLFHIKNFLIEKIGKIESDDLIYVYNPEGDLKMADTPAESVAAIANFMETKFNLPIALKESIFLVGQSDYSHRGVFLITDDYCNKNDYMMNEALQYDLDKDYGCSFFFYGIGERYSKLFNVGNFHPRVKYIHFSDPKNVKDIFFDDFDKLNVDVL